MKKVVSIMVLALVFSINSNLFNEDYDYVQEEYTVKSGDTLWSISEDFIEKNTYDRVYILAFMEDIRSCNKELASNSAVYPGQKLNIRYKVKKNKII